MNSSDDEPFPEPSSLFDGDISFLTDDDESASTVPDHDGVVASAGEDSDSVSEGRVYVGWRIGLYTGAIKAHMHRVLFDASYESPDRDAIFRGDGFRVAITKLPRDRAFFSLREIGTIRLLAQDVAQEHDDYSDHICWYEIVEHVLMIEAMTLLIAKRFNMCMKDARVKLFNEPPTPRERRDLNDLLERRNGVSTFQ